MIKGNVHSFGRELTSVINNVCTFLQSVLLMQKNKKSRLDLREKGGRKWNGTRMLKKESWPATSHGNYWGGRQKQGKFEENVLDIISANVSCPTKKSVTSPCLLSSIGPGLQFFVPFASWSPLWRFLYHLPEFFLAGGSNEFSHERNPNCECCLVCRPVNPSKIVKCPMRS